MTEEEIEIVARVTCRAAGRQWDNSSHHGKDQQRHWRNIAQAAITALDQYRERKARPDPAGYNEQFGRSRDEQNRTPQPLPPITLGPLFK